MNFGLTNDFNKYSLYNFQFDRYAIYLAKLNCFNIWCLTWESAWGGHTEFQIPDDQHLQP